MRKKQRFLCGALSYAACSVLAAILCGCTGPVLRQSFNDYGDNYADAQNRQVLLNLARLNNREPIYAFQLTQVQSSYTFNETLGLADLKSIGLPNSTTANVRTASGTLGESATHQPIFTLVPLAGDKYAQQMLAPIKPEIFYQLFDEGWPLDLLMRVLIERIEIEIDSPQKIIVLENDPSIWTPADPQSTNVVVDGPKGYYDRFLRACELAREFQKHGLIYLSQEPKVTYLSPPINQAPDVKTLETTAKDGMEWKRIEPTGPDDSQSLDKPLKPAEAAAPGESAKGPSEPEAAEPAATEGAEKAAPEPGPAGRAGTWRLAKSTMHSIFRLATTTSKDGARQESATRTRELASALSEKEWHQGSDNAVETFVAVMSQGFNVTDDTSKDRISPASNAPAAKATAALPEGQFPRIVQVRLVMRSLMGAMTALAGEQDQFYKFTSAYESARSTHTGWAPLPPSQMHPVLALACAPGDVIHNSVVELDYKDRHYAIYDPAVPSSDMSASWNRDVFRLLVQLSFLATADPTVFQTPSLIQLH